MVGNKQDFVPVTTYVTICYSNTSTAATLPTETTSRTSSATLATASGQANTQSGDILSVSGDSVLSGKKTIINTLMITFMYFILSQKIF